MKIIHRYLFLELLTPFFLSLLVLVILLLTQQALLIMNLLVNKGLSVETVFRLLSMIFPQFLSMIIPVSVLTASTATFHRLASDGEIIAFKASGISLSRLLLPLFLFAAIGFGTNFYLSLKAMETQGLSLQDLLVRVFQKKLSLAIKPQSFNNFMGRFIIYVEKMPTLSHIDGVFIYQKEKKTGPRTVIFAQSGEILNERHPPGLRLKLSHGTFFQEGSAQQYIRFGSYDLTITGHHTDDSIRVKSIDEIRAEIARSPSPDPSLFRALEDRYKNYTYPFSCFFFAFLGIPYGIYTMRSGRLAGFVFATVTVILFYMMNTIDDLMVSKRLLSPAAAALAPDIVLAALMTALLFMVFHEVDVKSRLPRISLPSWLRRRRS
ncbi:MAG: LptF/LptG family permease [Nitrospirae bacterium]|jgi:lipopolysaccharide export system permease protein|uniref:Permease YjgP/YjgQ family protein n=1 Tax=Leptospirillum ferrodiazotrophum TaxID=412449 RepID=C6HZI0_9BACT|nr:MAG: permease YjgP/YjgQ family protein [Leptospirillum ferrodiazotrophum]MCL5954176.1 LptF/LptG family permease [Nitrospirota bacterium]